MAKYARGETYATLVDPLEENGYQSVLTRVWTQFGWAYVFLLAVWEILRARRVQTFNDGDYDDHGDYANHSLRK